MIIAVLVSSSLTISIQIYNNYKENKIRIKNLKVEYNNKQMELITSEVYNAHSIICAEREKLINEIKIKLKDRVDVIHEILFNLYKKYGNSLNQNQFKEKVREILTTFNYNNQVRSFYIADLKGNEILYPYNPKFEGRNLWNFKSYDNRYIVREMIELVKNHGEGILNYKWDREMDNGIDKSLDYIAFVKLFKPMNWYIGLGTGYHNEEAKIKKDLLIRLQKIRYGKNGLGYLFINSYDGYDLIAETVNGKSPKNYNWEIEDVDGLKIVQEEKKAALKPNGGFIKYKWINPSTHEIGKKLAFVKGDNKWQWIIGAGVYMDDIDYELAELKKTYEHSMFKYASQSILSTLIVILALFPLIYFIQRALQSEFNKLISLFHNAFTKDEFIDNKKIKFFEIAKFTEDINKIMEAKSSSEKKLLESEEKYRTLFESATDGVLIIDKDFNIVDCNQTMLKMFNIDSKEALKQYSIIDDLSEGKSKKEKLLAYKEQALEGEELLFEWKSKKPVTNEVFDTLISVKKFYFGEKDLFIISIRDISKQKQIEEELTKIRQLESLGILAGGIAHDFNNLLSGIFGQISIMKMKIDGNEKIFKNIVSAEKTMDRAIALTKQLLTFSKGGTPVKETIDIKNLIKETSEFSMSGSNVKLKLEIDENLRNINADKGQISQVISNLIINACQAMDNNGEIIVKAENFDNLNFVKKTLSKKMYVKVSVVDNGIGIDEENLKKIFNPYFTTKVKGTGLGLASCFSIINKHNGIIEVNSEKGVGSTFTFFLEAVNEGVVDLSDLKNKKEKLSNCNILIMDDEEMILDVVKEMTKILGYNCDVCKDGKEAIEMYKSSIENKNPFDIIIMDLTIPGAMGGKETVLKIKEINKNAKVIVSTGYSNDPVVANYKEFGFCGYINKPFRIEDFDAVVKKLMNSQ